MEKLSGVGWSQNELVYPLVNIISFVDLPINSMVDLSIVFCMFTKNGFFLKWDHPNDGFQ